MPNRLAHETSRRTSASTPTTRSIGIRGATRRSARAQAEDKPILLVGRLLRLSLVSRDGARVVRGRGDGAPDERALRQRQGRSRGDARRRPDLPAGAAAAGRARRLAADDVPHARRACRSSAAPTSRRATVTGGPSFKRLLLALSEAWKNKRSDVLDERAAVSRGARAIAAHGAADGRPANVLVDSIERASAKLAVRIDRREGGFEGAPKFPNPKAMELILRGARRFAARQGCRRRRARCARWRSRSCKMAEGGIYDQLGGGFARYSTDAHWLVPHFEKMLYDNAQLLVLYAETLADDARADARARGARDGRATSSAICARPKAASTPPRTPTPRASRASSTSGRRTRCARRRRRRHRRARGRRLHALLRRHRRRQLERPARPRAGGREHPARRRSPARRRRGARCSPTSRRRSSPRAQQARAPRPRRQGARRQQRHGHRRAGRGGRIFGDAAVRRRRAPHRRVRARAHDRRLARAPSAHVQGAARRSCRARSTITRTSPTASSRSTKRPARRAGSRRRTG